FVGGDELVDPHRRDVHLSDRLRRLSRCIDPFVGIGISRSDRRHVGCGRRRRRLRRPGGLRHRTVGWGLRRNRTPPSRIGANDGLLPRNAERTARWKLVVHRRSSNTAHNSSSSSGQPPEKCMPMELAVENSGHSGDLRSKKKYTWSVIARICGGGVGKWIKGTPGRWACTISFILVLGP